MSPGDFLRAPASRPNGWKPPPAFNPSGVDPALLTFEEWERAVDPEGKSHPDSAYDWTLERMARIDRADYPELLRRERVAGITVELRYKSEPLRYVRTRGDGDVERDPRTGEVSYYTDGEALARGLPLVEYAFAAFDGGAAVAVAQDEWGCWLVVVAREYRGLGLGTIMQKLAREHAPGRPSGGFTRWGREGLRRVHREFVREALERGRYSRLVREGALTAARVRAVLASARHEADRRGRGGPDLGGGPPSTWLLHADGYGSFIVYDPRLRDLLADRSADRSHFAERMLKGLVTCQLLGEEGRWRWVLAAFGGETAAVRRLLMRLALSFCAADGWPLFVDVEDLPSADSDFAERVGAPDRRSGSLRQELRLAGPALDGEALAAPERRWRAGFDRYGEFETLVREMALSKFTG